MDLVQPHQLLLLQQLFLVGQILYWLRQPEKDKTATKYDTISFDEVYAKGLEVMDMTAFTLCKENKLPIIVFDMNKPGNLKKIMQGEPIGTLVEF